jgi:hypothetical protein
MSFDRTLIPVSGWAAALDLDVMCESYHDASSRVFEDYAKFAGQLLARAINLFASFKASEGAFGLSAPQVTNAEAYTTAWLQLFHRIEEWFSRRPPQMQSLVSIKSSDPAFPSPFPTVLYSSASGIAGTQFAHTAAILMLQRKPRDVTLDKNVRSILWHARQICGIALSNEHHGCWTNAVQPVWVAGRLMSHPMEHSAIVHLLEKIEQETGWATQWRIDDLKAHWGNLED